MAKVESFELDHTKVKAPYVRLITVEEGPKGDKISNFDLRLVQPNENAIPTGGLHTIEHLLASLLRDRLDGVIDCSPFGCRTGFHLITWGEHSTTEVAKATPSRASETTSPGKTCLAPPSKAAATTATTPSSAPRNGATTS